MGSATGAEAQPDRTQGTFLRHFLLAVLHDIHSVRLDNTDTLRFPERRGVPSRLVRGLRDRLLAMTRGMGFSYAQGFEAHRVAEKAALVLEHIDSLERLWTSLEDERSRDLLASVLAYRILGPRRVRLPIDRALQRERLRSIEEQLLRRRHSTPIAGGLGWLDEYDLAPLGLPMSMEAHCLNILNTFIAQQYRWEHGDRVVQVQPGDVVIDGGACWGDTTLLFAHQAGSGGQVIAFEFEPTNLAIMQRNLERNPSLAERVSVETRALWSEGGRRLDASSAGPGTRLKPSGESEGAVTTDTIDDLVARKGLSRVDFIKMDIEGAELDALRGAQATLRRDRPRLAISLYHRPADIWEIPEFIRDLGVGYRMSIDHFTIHGEETMLFCDVKGRREVDHERAAVARGEP